MLNNRDRFTSSISCIFSISLHFSYFLHFLHFLRPWPVEEPRQIQKMLKMRFIELGLLVCTMDIFCKFCIFCTYCTYCVNMHTWDILHILHNVHNLHITIEISISAYFRICRRFDRLRWRPLQHKLSWSDEFQYSWWSRLSRWRSPYFRVSKSDCYAIWKSFQDLIWKL